MDTLFSVDDAARALGGLSPWTVRAWLCSGKLRKTKVGGRTMIRQAELERFLRAENPNQSSDEGGK